jgi:hypothetical protein
MTYLIEASNPYRRREDNVPVHINAETDVASGVIHVAQLGQLEYKGFGLSREQQYMLWSIDTLDGSRVPTVLRSKFTNIDLAKNAIDTYLADKKKKPVVKKEKIDDAIDN